MTQQVVTASRLRDGRAVYLTTGGTWSERIAGSLVSATEDDNAAMLATAQDAADAQHIVDPYLVEVTLDDALPRPVTIREQIRANGPTVAYGATPSEIRQVA
ncbi:MAG: DUF2849 domain-containing protein [Proteobacteria bacterium]|jgi:hypothetical protein|nr:DUF2849 domain-containing protein [Pseudomonadota bacterium]